MTALRKKRYHFPSNQELTKYFANFVREIPEIEGLGVHGSSARGQADPSSDLDLLFAKNVADPGIDARILEHLKKKISVKYELTLIHEADRFYAIDFGDSLYPPSGRSIDVVVATLDGLPACTTINGVQILFDRGGRFQQALDEISRPGSPAWLKRRSTIAKMAESRLEILPYHFQNWHQAIQRSDRPAEIEGLFKTTATLFFLAAALEMRIWIRCKGGLQFLKPEESTLLVGAMSGPPEATFPVVAQMIKRYAKRFVLQFGLRKSLGELQDLI